MSSNMAAKRPTAPAPAPARCSAGRCAFDLGAGFPLLTTKKLHLRSIIHELLWFLQGDTNIRYLQENGVASGTNGPTRTATSARSTAISGATGKRRTGARSTRSPTRRRPEEQSRLAPPHRHAWNPATSTHGAAALPRLVPVLRRAARRDDPADQRPKLSCQLYQRSADIFLGVPFNIASYALLTLMLAQVCGYRPGDFVHTFGDAHLYSNHFEQARLQLSARTAPLPTMRLNPEVSDLFAFRFEDFTLEGYDPHPHIAAPVAV
jgi:thymidylate synthase